MRQQVSRYHPLLVTLHWVLAVLIIAARAIQPPKMQIFRVIPHVSSPRGV
jgi:cytochrome b561